MKRRMSTRFEKYWTESGRGDGQGDVENNNNNNNEAIFIAPCIQVTLFKGAVTK